jgi:hypothetical protein
MKAAAPTLLAGLLAAAPACSGTLTGSGGAGGGGDDDGSGGPTALGILSPRSGKTFDRDTVGALGYLVADVPLELEVPEGVQYVAYRVNGGEEQGKAKGPDFALDAEVRVDGDSTITVVAYDDAGVVVDKARVDVHVRAPHPDDCHGWLDLYGVRYQPGPAREGVEDPVTVDLPLDGVRYRYSGSDQPRSDFFMDCKLARALLFDAPILRERGVVEVADIGVYNYRCIGGGAPPCSGGSISQHAFAKAIDRAGFRTRDGTTYSVLNDWVIDPDSQPTCKADTSGRKDAWLHELICAEKAAGIWNIALTPNYNADHRNHFHTDLTPGGDYIQLAQEIEVDATGDAPADD